MNKHLLHIIIEVIILLILIVHTNNQNKSLKQELSSLRDEFQEFKEETVKYISGIIRHINPNKKVSASQNLPASREGLNFNQEMENEKSLNKENDNSDEEENLTASREELNLAASREELNLKQNIQQHKYNEKMLNEKIKHFMNKKKSFTQNKEEKFNQNTKKFYNPHDEERNDAFKFKNPSDQEVKNENLNLDTDKFVLKRKDNEENINEKENKINNIIQNDLDDLTEDDEIDKTDFNKIPNVILLNSTNLNKSISVPEDYNPETDTIKLNQHE